MQLLLQTLGAALVWQTQRVHSRLFYAACGMLPMTICLLWPGERRDLMTLLGLKWSATNYAALVITCVMTMLLQTGPIILLGLAKNEQTRLSASRILRDPLLATLAFRLGLVPVLIAAGLGIGKTVLLSSLTASASEATIFRTADARSWGFSLLLRVLRNAYFAYVYVMTGSAYAAYAAQVIVEVCGVPDLMLFEKTHAAYSHRLLVSALTVVGIGAFTVLNPLLLNPYFYGSWFYEHTVELATSGK